MSNNIFQKPLNLSDGFTIVELMIATLVFSMVLLLCATAVVQVGRMYYKGIIVNRTEDASRRVIDDITRSIQFGASGEAANFLHSSSDATGIVPGTQSICLGTVRYSYAGSNYVLGDSYDATAKVLPHVLWKDNLGTTLCKPANLSVPLSGGTELLGAHMRVVGPLGVSSANGLWQIHATVAYGDGAGLGVAPNLDCGVFRLNGTSDGCDYTACINKNSGGEFCAVSDLSTSVVKRL